jgi:RNA polymerase sigma factor (sigma-70 family)
MDAPLTAHAAMTEQDKTLAELFRRESSRLRHFIRRRVPDPADAEDIVADVFIELVEAARLLQPIEQVSAWLFRVARNRITDLFRRRQTRGGDAVGAGANAVHDGGEDDETGFDDLLPSLADGPDAAYARRVLIAELAEALAELPESQRSVFIAHEIDGLSFKDIAVESGESVNTLLSRKRYAVLFLRRRLQAIHDDFFDDPQ